MSKFDYLILFGLPPVSVCLWEAGKSLLKSFLDWFAEKHSQQVFEKLKEYNKTGK